MKKAILFVCAVLIACGAYYAYHRLNSEPKTRVLETAAVEDGNVRAVLVETGIIKPQVGAEVKIGARATGVIESLKVSIGDRVQKGQLIALIDDRELIEEIEAEKAALAVEKSGLEQVNRTYPERIKEAQSDLEYKDIAYARERNLIKEGFTTQDELDLARTQYEAAAAKFLALKHEFETQRKVLEARIQEIEAQLKKQDIRLSYTRIYAPMDGVVSALTAQEGETIVTGLQVANLVTIIDPSRLDLWIYVDETGVGQVKAGEEVEYTVDAYPDRAFRSVVDQVQPQPTIKDNIVYYLAIAKVDVKDAELLRPEMTAYVRIIYSERTNVLTAPNSAIKFQKGKSVVYRISKGKPVETVPVVVGIRGEEKTEILSGIRKGDIVATKILLPTTAEGRRPE